MSRSTRHQPFVPTELSTACTMVLLFFLLPVPSSTAETAFVTSNPDCRASDTEALACGGFGTLFLGTEPRCGDAVRLENGTFFSDPAGETLEHDEPRFPCAGGMCFTDGPQGPWVAVIDWNNEHGWSVGETIRQVSGFTVETRLFDLERPGLDALEAAPVVGDGHLLAQLCRVAEAAEAHPPVAVNLSFGRWAESGCQPSENDLTCVISEVIAHLRNEHGTVTFAAAGLGGDVLFPARDPGIVAVGLLDVAHFGRTGVARPLPQSPAGSAALFPGNGLFLEAPDGGPVWPAPPGSSYASAFAAGWWAAARAIVPRQALGLVTGCEGTLVPQAVGGRLRLACGSRVLPGSRIGAAADLIATALGRRPTPYGDSSTETLVTVESLLRRPLPVLTVSEAQARLYRPLPDCRTCVPCIVGGSGSDGEDGEGPTNEPTTSPDLLTLTGGVRVGGRLEIDLSGSAGVPRHVDLLGVYLQVGRLTFRFSDSENTTLLGELALGQVEKLVIRDLPVEIGDAPVSLVYKLRFADDPDTSFQGSTPILVHD